MHRCGQCSRLKRRRGSHWMQPAPEASRGCTSFSRQTSEGDTVAYYVSVLSLQWLKRVSQTSSFCHATTSCALIILSANADHAKHRKGQLSLESSTRSLGRALFSRLRRSFRNVLPNAHAHCPLTHCFSQPTARKSHPGVLRTLYSP